MRYTILIIVISALTLTACGGNKEVKSALADTPPPPSMPASPSDSPSTTSKNLKAPDDAIVSIKDTGKTDKIIFLVKNISEPSIDRSGYSVTKPEDNEKYIAVQVWLKNVSADEIKVFQSDFKLSDQSDAEFAEKGGVMLEHRKKPILFDEVPEGVTLKPNQSKSGWITFTTDKKSKATKIVYQNITVKL